jgi:hypothetical protein
MPVHTFETFYNKLQYKRLTLNKALIWNSLYHMYEFHQNGPSPLMHYTISIPNIQFSSKKSILGHNL